MVVTSLQFVFFIAVLFFIHLICPGKYRWLVLLFGSIAFYAIAGIRFLPFLLFSSLSVWLGARKIGQIWKNQEEYFRTGHCDSSEKSRRKAQDKKKAKRILVLLLVLNLGYLILEKSLNLLDSRFDLLPPGLQLIVPLGISYYTFSVVGYLLDVYWKKYSYEENPFRFLLFTIYFPHIIQGPISRYQKLGAELKKELTVTYENTMFGLQRILWGCFKKLVIADRAVLYTSNAFASAYNENGLVYVVGILFDVIQIYMDFSGYMDIMCGISQMFGVTLEENFDRPFFAKSVPEFWRRWHMSLGSWFKDYVYFPMAKRFTKFGRKLKDKVSPFCQQLIVTGGPILVTWILTGLWHGTGIDYLMWGLYYGILITCSNLFSEPVQKWVEARGVNRERRWYGLLQMGRICLIFAGGRLLTRMPSLMDCLRVLKRMLFSTHFGALLDGGLCEYGLNAFNLWVVVLCTGIVWVVDVLESRGSVRSFLAEQKLVFRWTIYLVLFFGVVVLGMYCGSFSMKGFAYQQF